ncbi:MAG TPA: aminotransferase class V-fold PLP-dependent enzyme [Longimicrobiales bacterium]|nr:aminotransferase class V-fold PLP-dependent enzyme [Longimicrobiales bacterium]
MSHYLDFAATSAVRPPPVAEAMARFVLECGATPGRGAYGPALEAGRLALRCRRALQRLLGLPGDPGRIAFMQNATHALNTALWGVLGRRDAVVVTAYDHNAVLRPAAFLARERGVEVRMLAGTPDGRLDYEEGERLVRGARLLVVNSVSNVLGHRLPLEELAGLAHAAGALVLVDTAQGAGHLPLDCGVLGADLVAFTGHKGMLGPQGTGGLWVREGVEVEPFLTGGAGGDSTRREMPDAMPDRLEAGTVNAPGLAGLEAGLAYVLQRGVEELHREEARLKSRLRAGLAGMRGVTVLSPEARDGVGIVTLTARTLDPATLAHRLEAEWGVQGRAGLHCAPECHRLLGTVETGALRLSLGWASSEEDVDRALEGIQALTGPRVVGPGKRTG